ncbi:MAG: YbjN domain-containing protein [Saprospiraceae bacterium]|nr:YbjN domain-containing protein [Saprospiraceae bacterium]
MNKDYFKQVKEYAGQLGYTITYDNAQEGLLMVNDEKEGIAHLMLGVSFPMLIIEKFIGELSQPSLHVYQQLLQKNRDIVHGAFVLDETGKRILFRDTLQLENLDLNELESAIGSLGLLLSEYGTTLNGFCQ